ncbi:DUF962 domain-containing protein [Brevibacillus migulae]|uniref:DUF962 domain-containing protein n=1 Tax=Brevibacillus migulae TaxID=1644114 RepID=UPI00106EC7C7|nr:DUF962 domain-containing protein [Brevibacillus migulae]
MFNRIKKDLNDYQNAHQNKWNQILHYFAFLFAFLAWISLFFDRKMTICLAILHYTLAWVGHFIFERNKPASFKYPFVGFYAGFLGFFLKTFEIISGRKVLP